MPALYVRRDARRYAKHIDAGQLMTFLPIVERELRLSARRRRSYLARSGTALGALLIGFGVIATSLSAGRNPSQMGQDLFGALSLAAFLFALLAGPFLTADCLSEEKREGTLGLLFLTGLRSHDIVPGKLMATALPAFFWPLALTPVLSLSLLLGGVTGGELGRMMLVLPVTLLFSLAGGLLISALSRHGQRAIAGTILLVVGLQALLFTWGFLLQQSGRPWLGMALLLPSPVYGFQLVFDPAFQKAPGHFSSSIALVLGQAAVFLAAAFLRLPKLWQDQPVTRRKAGRSFREELRRDPWLGRNPIFWLSQRNRGEVRSLWLFLGVAAVFALVGVAQMPAGAGRGSFIFVSVFLLHAMIKLWIARDASRRLSEDRQSGELELLLTTPLDERKILRGRLLGLKRKFWWPVGALLLVDCFLLFGGTMESLDEGLKIGFIAGMGLFLADAYALAWVGLFNGLQCRSSTRAFHLTAGVVLLLPWLAFLGLLGLTGLFSSGAIPSFGQLVTVWFGASYVVDLGFCGWAINHLRDGFRSLASQSASGPGEATHVFPG